MCLTPPGAGAEPVGFVAGGLETQPRQRRPQIPRRPTWIHHHHQDGVCFEGVAETEKRVLVA